MALSKLDSLYMAVVADHSKHPHHQGQIEDVDQIQLNNPTCGDVIQLSVKFDENDRVQDIAFVNSQRIKCATLSWNSLNKAIERSK